MGWPHHKVVMKSFFAVSCHGSVQLLGNFIHLVERISSHHMATADIMFYSVHNFVRYISVESYSGN